jgi:predicted ABC-type ATPase
MPTCWIIAGPNGAGKTTFALKYLPLVAQCNRFIKLVRRLRTAGWRVELIYLALPSIEISRLRVSERVTHGGHDIPLKDIERRFPRSLTNLLDVFSVEVDICRCFMNNNQLPELVFEQQYQSRKIVNNNYYQNLLILKNITL